MFRKTKNILAIAGILVVGFSFGISRSDQFDTRDRADTFVCSKKALEPKSRETRQYNQDISEQNRLTKRQTKLLSDPNVANDTCKNLKKKERARCEGDVAELKAITRELARIEKRIREYESCKFAPKCGSAVNNVFIAPPTENLCASGNVVIGVTFDPTTVGSNGEGMWKWRCGTIGSSTGETCYAQSVMVYGWSIGEWGACSNGIQYRTVQCIETYSSQPANGCTGEAPESSRACSEVNNLHIQSSHYADVLDAANRLADLGIITNYSLNPTQYQLNNLITRQEILSVILNAMKLAPAPGYQCQNIFSDISDPSVCAIAETALANGLTRGTTNEQGQSFFRGTDFVTLYEMFIFTMKSQCIRPESSSVTGIQSMAEYLGITNASTLNMTQAASRGDTYISLATFHEYFNQNVTTNPSLLDSSIVSCADRMDRSDEDVLCNLFPDLCQ